MIVVEHWFDFTCPYCYIAQDRNAVLRWAGIEVVELPFSAHPEIGPGGRPAPDRRGPAHRQLDAEARRAGLVLDWSDRIPFSQPALIRAEIVREQEPDRHAEFCSVVFDSYFARGRDIERDDVLDDCAAEAQVTTSFGAAAALRAGRTALERSQRRAESIGVTGTPAWLIDGQLLQGLRPHRDFQRIARTLTGGTRP